MVIKCQNWRRLYAGLLLLVFGLAGVYFAAGLKFGAAASMGPGFLPTICSGLIVVLGTIVVVQALSDDVDVVEPPVPRAVFMIFLSIGVFALVIEQAGLGITVFVTAFIASYAGPARLAETLVLSTVAAVVAVIIFVTLLGLPIPVWPELA